MESVHLEICAARSCSDMASSLRWSKVSPPRQPVRSRPLNSAMKPAGGLAEVETSAAGRDAAMRTMKIQINSFRDVLRIKFILRPFAIFLTFDKAFSARDECQMAENSGAPLLRTATGKTPYFSHLVSSIWKAYKI